MNLSDELHKLLYQPSREKFQDYCLRFDRLIRALRQVGDKIDADGAMILFLQSMPPEHGSIVSALHTIADTELKMELVRVKIEEYEQSKIREKPQVRKVAGMAFTAQKDYSQFPCFNCGLFGHKRAACFRPGGGAHRIVSSANGLDSGRQSHRVEPLWRPISEFRLVPASPERLQPLLLIGLFWCPFRWPRRPKSRPLAEPSIAAAVEAQGGEEE